MPVPLTSFVGREQEVAAVAGMLCHSGVRLVTLTGPGGVGKTRLALRITEEFREHDGDGIAFVSLAPVTVPAIVPSVVAQSLGVRESGDRPLAERLGDVLRNRMRLLVLDNFEQVAEAAPLVTNLLAACPDLRILVTSRVLLRLSGEHHYPVRPLALPDPASTPATQARAESVRLFADRARAADPTFTITPDNARTVAAICHRLDGLPLAVELAAAKIRVLPPSALLPRLAHALPLLTGGRRDDPARLRTMRDAIAWSYELLTPAEQHLFHRLAIFSGGFTLEAAEDLGGGVVPDVLSIVESLAEQSLIHRIDATSEGPDTGAPRFGMLEMVREFGLERLEANGEADTVRRHHAEYALALAERLGAGLDGPDQGRLLQELAQEDGNMRAALGWANEHAPVLGLRLALALAWSWRLRGRLTEGRTTIERALAAAGDADLALRSNGLDDLAMFASDIGDSTLSLRSCEESLALWKQLGDPWGIARARMNVGLEVFARGDYAAACPYFEEALAAFRGLGDDRRVALALLWLGRTTLVRGNPHEARRLFDESLAIFTRVGYTQRVARLHYDLGTLEVQEGNAPAAAARFREALDLFRQVGHQFGIADAALALGWVALESGDTAASATRLAEALSIMHEMDSWWGIADALEGCAAFATARGRPDLALSLAGAASALRAPSAYVTEPFGSARLDRWLDRARRQLGNATANAAWPTASGADRREVVARALALLAEPMAAPVETPDRHGLSERELDVLRLVAAGHTDLRIAELLFLSKKTVNWHVGNILGKLGVANRAEAAAFAIRNGLV